MFLVDGEKVGADDAEARAKLCVGMKMHKVHKEVLATPLIHLACWWADTILDGSQACLRYLSQELGDEHDTGEPGHWDN